MEMMIDKFAIDCENKSINININDYITNAVTSYSYTYTDMYEINVILDNDLIKYIEFDIYKISNNEYLIVANIKGYTFEYLHNELDVKYFIDFITNEFNQINQINSCIFI